MLLAAAQNLSLLVRVAYGAGTPKSLADREKLAQPVTTGLLGTLWILLSTLWVGLRSPWRPRPAFSGALPFACAA